MLNSDAGFAKYSKPMCWVVAAIALLLAGFVFTGDSPTATINGLLWLALACVFAITALIVGRSAEERASTEAGEK